MARRKKNLLRKYLSKKYLLVLLTATLLLGGAVMSGIVHPSAAVAGCSSSC